MDLDAYVTEHRAEWQRLEYLARRHRPTAAEIDEMIALYQRVATQLSVVRSRSPDPALVARLSRLVLAARGALSPGRSFSVREVVRFVTTTFPAAVYRALPWWGAVAGASVLLAYVMITYVAGHPEVQRQFLDDAEIRRLVEHEFEGYYSANAAQNFALQVWLNNAWVSAVCLASGVLIVPVLYVLGTNVVNVGIVGGVMVGHGRGDLFLGMIAPHGLLELTAVFVAAGVGLRIGWSWIAPPAGLSRGRSLGEAARAGMSVALGLAGVLLVSGLIEAFVTPSPLPTVLRVAIGVLALGAFLAYVVVLGSRAVKQGETGDLDRDLGEATLPR